MTSWGSSDVFLHFALILVALAGCMYFGLRSRRFDFFTVGFFSSAMYFLPGLVGYTLSPVTPASPIKIPVQIVPEAYAIMLLVLSAVFLSTIVWDQFGERERVKQWVLADAKLAANVAFWCGLVGMLLTWMTSGGAAFAADKRVVIENVGRWHILWDMGAALGALLAFEHRRWSLLAGCFLLIAVDMYIGFRFTFAMTFIGLVTLWLHRQGKVSVGSLPKKYWMLISLGVLFIISFQNLKAPLRDGDWGEIGRRLSDPKWYLLGILTSEPFTTQTILNEIVRRDFRTGSDHLWSASQHLILFAPSLGAEDVRFGDQFQPALFPLVDHGLANNIWAQMWSSGGWTLLSIFVVVHCCFLGVGSYLLRYEDKVIRCGVVLFFSYWAFYVHRNELLVQAGLQKQVFMVWVGCIFFSMVVSGAMHAPRSVLKKR